MAQREKAISSKTLVCLLQGLAGKVTHIDFRDETAIYGRIDSVDGYMNIEMSNVDYQAPSGEVKKFAKYCCQGKFIRYVMIPENFDCIKSINEQLAILAKPPRGRGGRGGRGRGGRGGRGRGGGRGGGGRRDGGSRDGHRRSRDSGSHRSSRDGDYRSSRDSGSHRSSGGGSRDYYRSGESSGGYAGGYSSGYGGGYGSSSYGGGYGDSYSGGYGHSR
ncbi:sm domain-containing protein [Nephila pilipes]|uniref:Sm domain-containing protein n=1 Tax=Nephila pilipes TaxID=299642 RepID=A0A8X6NLA2_NEPPI|nr:sm domain-containing protein [Nephila pilipes]